VRKYAILIEQIRQGIVEIEAESREDALDKADEMYNRQGKELPEMDDCEGLRFTITE
jgi:hypothetical protein